MRPPIRTIAVIVPTTGRRDLTALKAALGRQTRAATEVIVVEDRAQRGSAWARNRGIEQSGAELLAFLDDDCVPAPEWLESLAGAIDDHDAAVAGGTYEEEDPFLRERRDRQSYPDAVLIDREGWVGAGGNIAYRRDVLERIRAADGHYFHEGFRISQDKELAWRVRMLGERLVFVPARVRHTKHCSGWAYLREQFGRGVGIAGLYLAARGRATSAMPDRGLLWAGPGRPGIVAWSRMLVLKAIGPFDRGSFHTTTRFLLFWLGEKSQGLGFLWGLVRRPFARRSGGS
jgi:glycosyltransferase involved in cell wall biosynthesis